MYLGWVTRGSFAKGNEIDRLFSAIVNNYWREIDFGYCADRGHSVMFVLCDRNHFKCLKLLLDIVCHEKYKKEVKLKSNKTKLDVNKVNILKRTCLSQCLKNRSYECLVLLLDEKYQVINSKLDLNIKMPDDNNVDIWKYCQINKMNEYTLLLKQFEKRQKNCK